MQRILLLYTVGYISYSVHMYTVAVAKDSHYFENVGRYRLMISWPEKCLILSTFEAVFKPILTDIKQKIHNPTFVCSLTILGGSIFKYNHYL